MENRYIHVSPGQRPPRLAFCPFRTIIVSEVETLQEWRDDLAKWLVESGCLYVVAWGVECEKWHDTVDWTVLEAYDFGDIPDNKFVMTTWHNKEPLSEALWFAGQCAFHPDIELDETLILHIADEANRDEIMATYSTSQILSEE